MRIQATILRALRQAARNESVDEELLAAIVRQESGFDAHAIGDLDAGVSLGLGQLNLRGAGSEYRSNPSWLMDANVNLHAAASYLRRCLDVFPDDEARAISAYNQGCGNAVSPDWWSVNGDSYVVPVQRHLALIRGEGLQETWDADVPEGFRSYGQTLLDVAITLKGVCDMVLARVREARALCGDAASKLEGL